MNDIKLLEIARDVRHIAEKHPDSCYDLSCWCAICSFKIFKILRNITKQVYFAIVDGGCCCHCHCFVIYKNKMIDVTATQFGEKENIVIDDIDTIQYSKKWYWDKSLMKKFASVKAIKKEMNKWPEDQNPFCVDLYC